MWLHDAAAEGKTHRMAGLCSLVQSPVAAKEGGGPASAPNIMASMSAPAASQASETGSERLSGGSGANSCMRRSSAACRCRSAAAAAWTQLQPRAPNGSTFSERKFPRALSTGESTPRCRSLFDCRQGRVRRCSKQLATANAPAASSARRQPIWSRTARARAQRAPPQPCAARVS